MLSFYLNQSGNFSACQVLAGEALVLGETSFLIFLSSVWSSNFLSFLTFKGLFLWKIPWEQAFPIG